MPRAGAPSGARTGCIAVAHERVHALLPVLSLACMLPCRAQYRELTASVWSAINCCVMQLQALQHGGLRLRLFPQLAPQLRQLQGAVAACCAALGDASCSETPFSRQVCPCAVRAARVAVSCNLRAVGVAAWHRCTRAM